MTSREYHYKLKNKYCPDERRFNNFSTFTPSKPLACSFDTMEGKILDNTIKHFQGNFANIKISNMILKSCTKNTIIVKDPPIARWTIKPKKDKRKVVNSLNQSVYKINQPLSLTLKKLIEAAK